MTYRRRKGEIRSFSFFSILYIAAKLEYSHLLAEIDPFSVLKLKRFQFPYISPAKTDLFEIAPICFSAKVERFQFKVFSLRGSRTRQNRAKDFWAIKYPPKI